MTLTLANPVESREFENTTSRLDLSSAAHEAEPLEQEVTQHVVLLRGGELQIDIERADGAVIATDRTSGLFGEGDEVEHAILDLLEHLDLSLRDLAAHEGQLAPEMAAELARLRSLFGE